MIIDGGSCEVGLESTIVDVTGKKPVILRPGGITKKCLKKLLELLILTLLFYKALSAGGKTKSPWNEIYSLFSRCGGISC